MKAMPEWTVELAHPNGMIYKGSTFGLDEKDALISASQYAAAMVKGTLPDEWTGKASRD